ncbi:MAG: hypothetical protein IPH28_08145 [Cytophagaceae bacterium]|nr:hypothetical protein [Cytophagaceae bacterium]
MVDNSYNGCYVLSAQIALQGLFVEKPYQVCACHHRSLEVPTAVIMMEPNDYIATTGNNVWAQEDNNPNNGTGAKPISATLGIYNFLIHMDIFYFQLPIY